ncbi:helix-turn-helix domain-containing protein [Hymenobacter terricola]|uniref:helix-turn-helix domain-containing protein n=1 Tax=Hymenobacter terricola TaxID=2819236 RepID=UPI001B312416|nr:helix-turn-helix transcriptional regulator [Hymenobacter terricola]
MVCRAADRLSHLCVALNLTLAQFAHHIGLTIRRAKRVLKTTHKPSIGLMARVRRAFPNVNPDWLLLGEGEVFLSLIVAPAANAGNYIGINYGHCVQVMHPACHCLSPN